MLRHLDRFFIGGEWVTPSSDATITVTDPATEERFMSVAEARAPDLARAVGAAHEAFATGPWPRLSPAERARYLRAIAGSLRRRAEDVANIWPRQSGVVYGTAAAAAARVAKTFDYYAALADSFPFEEEAQPTNGGSFALLVREPVGVVGAIIPWNAPLSLTTLKLAPALLAGCTVVLKLSPEAPGEGYLLAEIAEEVGLPPGVLNVITADREVSELLVTDPRVDKITFTGSTAAGRRIASLCGERIARCTLELGGKSAAVVLDDVELETVAETISQAATYLSGQVCASLTRIVVSRHRHDAMLEALSSAFSRVRVGDPFDPETQMGPLVSERQRDRVLRLHRQRRAGRRHPGHRRPAPAAPRARLVRRADGVRERRQRFDDRARGDLRTGPERDRSRRRTRRRACRQRHDLRAQRVGVHRRRRPSACRGGPARSGTVGHNAMRMDMGIAFGGFKQSGIGREGGVEGLYPFLETKTVILEGRPSPYDVTSD